MSAPYAVAPHTGAWIEIARPITTNALTVVAPHTGAWIEIVTIDVRQS